MLGWEHPELFYELPCQYNLQSYIDIDQSEYSKSEEVKKADPEYRNCKQHGRIIHVNGLIP